MAPIPGAWVGWARVYRGHWTAVCQAPLESACHALLQAWADRQTHEPSLLVLPSGEKPLLSR